MTLVSLSGVGKDFGDVTALTSVDLDIDEGEFLTLLGPSGCGKLTLLRILGGLEEPSRGQLTYLGRSLVGVPPEKRPFNLVFQSYALFPHMTVYENVAYGLRVSGVRQADLKRRVADMLEMVDLAGLRDRSPRFLSGGQQQRVALARALVNEPRLLLLDEPLGALDLQLRKRMQEELRGIQRRLGTTFVYVTHAQDEALTLSHRIVLMSHGKIKQVGNPQEIYNRPQSQYVAEFVGDTSLVPCRVVRSTQSDADIEWLSGGRATFPHYLGQPFPAGENAFVSLRPESLTITPGDSGMLQGTVADVVFRGAGLRHVVRVGENHEVWVDTPKAISQVTAGSAVSVSSLHGGVVVRADESALGDQASAGLGPSLDDAARDQTENAPVLRARH